MGKNLRKQYEPIARAAAQKYGVDPDIFVSQINQESGFDENVIFGKRASSAGALGIAQFMPATAKSYGINPLNPEQALDAAARYMQSGLKKYNGDYGKALAAYNAGGGAVDKHGGIPPYKETQNYVNVILKNAGKPAPTFNENKSAPIPKLPSVDEIMNNPDKVISESLADIQASQDRLQSSLDRLNTKAEQKDNWWQEAWDENSRRLAEPPVQNEYEQSNIVPKSGGFWNDAVKSIQGGFKYYQENPDDAIVDALATGVRFAGGMLGGGLAIGSGGLGIVGGAGIAAGASYFGDWMSSAVRGQNFDIRKADHFGAAMNAVGVGAFGVGTRMLRAGMGGVVGKGLTSAFTGATDEAASLAWKMGTGATSNVAQGVAGSAAFGRDYTIQDAAMDTLFGAGFEIGGHFIDVKRGNLSKTLGNAAATKTMSEFENMTGNPIIHPTRAIPDVLLGDVTAKAFAGQEVATKVPELNMTTPETINATLKDTQIQQTNLSILLDNPKLAKEIERYSKLETDLGTQKLKVDNLPEGSEGQLKAIADYEKQLTKLDEIKSGIFNKYENTYGIAKEDHNQLLKRQIADIPNISSEKGKASLGSAVADARKTRDTIQTFKDGNEALERLALNDMISQQPKWVNGNKMSETALNMRDGSAKALVEAYNKLDQTKRTKGLREVINQVTSLEGLKTTNSTRLDRYFASVDPDHPNYKPEYNLRNLATWATKEAKRPSRKDAMEQQLKEMGAAHRFANNSFEGQIVPEEFVPQLREVLGDTFTTKSNGDGTASFQWNNYDPYAERVAMPNSVDVAREKAHNMIIADLTPNESLLKSDIHPTAKEILEYEFLMQAKGMEGYEEAVEMGLDGRLTTGRKPTAEEYQRDRELSELRALDSDKIVMSREISRTSTKIQEVFGLNKAEADNTAVVIDSVIKEMAIRQKKEVGQVYSDIIFKKSKLEEIMNVPKNNALFQMVDSTNINKMMRDRLSTAEKLEKAGKSDREIYLATYWTRDKFDGKWYYDLSKDYAPTNKLFRNIKVVKDGVIPIEMFNMSGRTLKDVLDFPELFSLYPTMKNVNILLENDRNMKWAGAYFYSNDTIKLNLSQIASDIHLVDTIHHEMQHALQKRMGIKFHGQITDVAVEKYKHDNPKASDAEIAKFRYNKYATEWSELQARTAGYLQGKKYNKSSDLTPNEYVNIDLGTRGGIEVWGSNIKDGDKAAIAELSKFQKEMIATAQSKEVLFAKNVRGIPKGAMQALDNGKAIIHALTNPDVSTPLHEMAHVYERVLTPAERKAVQDWTKHKKWSVKTSEKFAEGFEQYLKNGVAPTGSGLDRLFRNFKNFMKDLFIGLTGRVTLNDGIKKIYAQMVKNVDINSMQAIRKEFLIEKYNLDRTKPLNPQIDRIAAIAKAENELARSAVAYSKMTGLEINRLGQVKLGEQGLNYKTQKSWFGILQNAHDYTNDLFAKLDPRSVDPMTGSFTTFTDHYNFNENYHRKTRNALQSAFPNQRSEPKFEDLNETQLDALAYALSYEDSLKTLDKVQGAFAELGKKTDHMQMRYDMLETQRTNYNIYKNNPEAIKKSLGRNIDDLGKYIDSMQHTTPNHRFFSSFLGELGNIRIYMEGTQISAFDKFLHQMHNKVIDETYFDKNYKKPVLDFMQGLGIGDTKDHHIGKLGEMSRGIVQIANSTVLTSTPLNAGQAYMEGHGNIRSAFRDAADLYRVNTGADLEDFAKEFLKSRGFLKPNERFIQAVTTSALENNKVRSATAVPQLGKLSKTKLGSNLAEGLPKAIYELADFWNGIPFRLAAFALDNEMAVMSAKIAQGIFKNGEYKDMESFEAIYDSVFAKLQTNALQTSRNLLTSKLVGNNFVFKLADLPSIQKIIDFAITTPEKWLHDVETNTNTNPLVAKTTFAARELGSAIARGAEAATFQFSGFISESASKHVKYIMDTHSRITSGKMTGQEMLEEVKHNALFLGLLGVNGTLVGGSINALLSLVNAATKESASDDGKLKAVLDLMDKLNFYGLVMQDSGIDVAKLSLNQLENTSMIVNNFLQVLSIPVEAVTGEYKDRGILKSRAADVGKAAEAIKDFFYITDERDAAGEKAAVLAESLFKVLFTGTVSNIRAVTAQSQGHSKLRSTETIYDAITNGTNSDYYMSGDDAQRVSENMGYAIYKQAAAMAGLRDKDLQDINDQWQTASSIALREGDIVGAIASVPSSIMGTDKE